MAELRALLGFLRTDVLGFHPVLVFFEFVGLEINGAEQIGAGLGRSLDRPRFFRQRNLTVFVWNFELERLHHLPDKTVGQHDCRVAVFVREIEGQHGKVGHLLYRGRRQHDIAVVAVAAAFHHGEIVALFRPDVAEARSAAHYIDDHAGQFGAGEVGNAFLHEAEARPGGSTHDADPSRRCPIHHVDGGNFAFRLQERPADLRQIQRRSLDDFAGRCDRIPVVRPAPGKDCSLNHSDIAFTQLPHVCLLVLPALA